MQMRKEGLVLVDFLLFLLLNMQALRIKNHNTFLSFLPAEYILGTLQLEWLRGRYVSRLKTFVVLLCSPDFRDVLGCCL